jgi:hypothetical protein
LLWCGKNLSHVVFADLSAAHLLSGVVGQAILSNLFSACHTEIDCTIIAPKMPVRDGFSCLLCQQHRKQDGTSGKSRGPAKNHISHLTPQDNDDLL